ncbi:MAG: glycosyltransferase family A protein [Candidatus Berkelbacteria bacterium]
MKASIIIRTKNEAKRIGEVLELLVAQTEKDFEVIIVDSGSTDQTLVIVKKYDTQLDLKIFEIEPEQFSYPFACNYGAKRALGDILIYISGHSIPIGKNWLRDGLMNFEDKKIAGVYGSVLPSKDASVVEFFGYLPGYFTQRKNANHVKMGIMGNTNAAIRRELWEKHSFDETYIDGGEDGEWAYYHIQKGFDVVQDPKFAVHHSHGFGLVRYIQQNLHWHKIADKFLSQYRDQ